MNRYRKFLITLGAATKAIAQKIVYEVVKVTKLLLIYQYDWSAKHY